MLKIFNRFVNLEKEQAPIVKSLFEDIIRESIGIRYVSSIPADEDVGFGEFVILDDGTATRRIYVRTGQSSVRYWTLT